MVAHTRIDRYEIKEILGQGGMGVVYRAYDPNRKGFVALKTMKDAADPVSLELFNQEWRTLANLAHPNIVDVLNSGAFEDDGQKKPFFVMPLLPGKTLDKLIKESGHLLTPERVVEILVQTCRGLQAAHSQGLTHRDLKPSNLFVLSDDSVKIIDFGMVHLADSTKSATGIKGTLHYMAPEQIELKEITAATDIFALGVVAYEALTGRKPFDRASDRAVVDAIRREFPPPASELNPAVGKPLAQVIAKAMAKNPWNRFSSAREFSDHVQRAMRGEPIEAFDTARLQPRLERARKALTEGDFDYAHEILTEVQLEGHVDSQINVLLDEVKDRTRAKAVRQLLDSARTRLEEEEYPLAWQKVQEALQRDPGNAEAEKLQAEIDTRRKDQQIEKWRRLVQEHLHNNAFAQARHAIEQMRNNGADEASIRELVQLVDKRQQEYQRACDDKEAHFQSAMRSYGTGEISAALSKLEKVIAIDTRTPGLSMPARDELYRETYDKVRSEWESIQRGQAEIERAISTGDLTRAAEMVNEQCAKYPNDLGLQALRLKVEDLTRQEKSAYIADIGRRVEAEPDLNRRVQYLDEALAKYPNEPHFQELVGSLRKKRDLVESIVAKARQSEQQGMLNECLGQWSTLRNIYPQYPGLDYEVERVVAACEVQRRQETKLEWVAKIDDCLQSGDYERAFALASQALETFSGDQELQTLTRLAQEGRDRSAEAMTLTEQAQTLIGDRRYTDATDALRRAVALDPHSPTISSRLADTLATQAQALLATDWHASEALVREALQVAPEHERAKSLRPAILLAKRAEFIDTCVSEARQLQAAGDISAALDKIQYGLTAYPNDARLLQLQKTFRDQLRSHRDRDLEHLKHAAETAEDQTSLTALLERSIVLSGRYPGDHEISAVKARIEEKVKAVSTTSETKVFPLSSAAQPVLAKERQAPAPAEAGSSEPKKVSGGQRTAVAAIGSVWLAARNASERALASGRQWAVQSARAFMLLPVYWRAAAGVVPLIAVLIAVLLLRTSAPKRGNTVVPPEPTTTVIFQGNIDGATIAVDGQALQEPSKQLTVGSHELYATRLGYEPVKRPLSVQANMPPVRIDLQPEPQTVRVTADLTTGTVLLDGDKVGDLLGGNFTYDLRNPGPHTLKLMDGNKEIFAVQFETKGGEAAKITAAPVAREFPVIVVSRLGGAAAIRTSTATMKLTSKAGQHEPIPADGRDLSIESGQTELTVDTGAQPVSVPIESTNAPLLAIVSGTAAKGTLVVESNVSEADVYINGRKSPRRLLNNKWVGQYPPGDYTVEIVSEGYDRAAPHKIRVAQGTRAPVPINLTRTVTNAFLQVERCTPDADIVDASRGVIGRTGADGSALVHLTPDVEYSVHLRKENFESSAPITKKSAVRETWPLRDIKLVPYATLEISSVTPADTTVLLKRTGEQDRVLSSKSLRLRQGSYTIIGKPADTQRYVEFTRSGTLKPGETEKVDVTLDARKSAPVPQSAARTELKEVVVAHDWRTQDGFQVPVGPARVSQLYFQHVFDCKRLKKTIGMEKIGWRTVTHGQDYIEFKVDDKNFVSRPVIDKKQGAPHEVPHGAGKKDVYRVGITVENNRIIVTVDGKVVDTIEQIVVQGPTIFDGKAGLKLVR